MATVDRLEVRVVTGNQGTNQPAYVSFGGREFLLDTAGNNFTPGKDETFIFGQGGNVLNTERNDPRGRLPLDLDQADAFPVYLRLGGGNNWAVKRVELTAQAGARFVAFQRVCGGQGLVLSAAAGQRLFLKKDDDFTAATFQGSAEVRVFGIALTQADPDVIVTPFRGRLEFRQNRTAVTASFDDISGTVAGFTITAKRNGSSSGTFTPATGQLDLTLPLRVVLPPSPLGVGNDSNITFALTTRAVGDLQVSPRNPATGDLRLVGSAVFQNGDLRGKTAHLILAGKLSPPVA